MQNKVDKVSIATNVKTLASFVEKNKIPDELLQSLSFHVFSGKFNVVLTEEVLQFTLATYNLGRFDGYWEGYNDKEDKL